MVCEPPRITAFSPLGKHVRTGRLRFGFRTWRRGSATVALRPPQTTICFTPMEINKWAAPHVCVKAIRSGRRGRRWRRGGFRRGGNKLVSWCSRCVTVRLCVPKESSWKEATRLQQKQTKLQFVAASRRESHLVCGRPKFVPTPTRGRLWTTFLTVATSGRLNMNATAGRHRKGGEESIDKFYFLPYFLRHCFKKINILGFLLTSVGHEDFHCGVLQQVSPGKDGPDLCEQPFPV